jgi:phosphoenolpyruvate-protein phosphotransferase
LAVEFSFSFPLPQGLHARPAGIIQECAERNAAAVYWDNRRTGATADAKSVLALIGSDTLHNDPCRIRVEGPSEREALAELRHLLTEVLPRKEAEAAAAQAAPAGGGNIPRILALEGALYFAGVPASAGVVRGPVFIHAAAPELDPARLESSGWPGQENAAFIAAAEALESEMRSRLAQSADKTERAVLEAHLAIVRDRAFRAKVAEFIGSGGCGAAEAVRRAGRFFGESMQASRSVYIRERMADIRDVARRLIGFIAGGLETEAELRLASPAVLAADDLPPSKFLALPKGKLLGVVLERAGVTSHTLILCRARGLPAITGCEGILRHLKPGEEIFLDGGRGVVVPSPAGAVARYFEREADAEARRRAKRREHAALPGMTADGRRIEVAANIGDPEEMAGAWEDGAEAVGLFRTELLLLGRATPPSEEEQYAVYARAAREAGGRPVIVRTFDIGGDKPVPFLALPAEGNPFLGNRGIRLYNQSEGLIRAQLRAILRAAALGPLKVMFPMVATVDEVLMMKDLLGQVKANLAAEGAPHRADVEVGIMVEVPSAALFVDRFSEHVDFFSVGSNDLLQYVFAADRGNPAVRALNRPHHPAFLRLLKSVVDEAHGQGRRVGLCGEMAGSGRWLPLLVGLGFDELSMTPAAIAGIKSALRALSLVECEHLVRAALESARPEDVDALLDTFEAGAAPAELITREMARLHSASASRAEALQELGEMMESAGRVESRAALETALWQREDTFSTGIGFGAAIPHCQTAAARGANVAFLRFGAPFDWDGTGGEPVDFAVMLALPAGGSASRDHLRLLARLSRRLAHEEFREALRTASDEDDVVDLISAALK